MHVPLNDNVLFSIRHLISRLCGTAGTGEDLIAQPDNSSASITPVPQSRRASDIAAVDT